MPDHRTDPDPAEMAELRQLAVQWTALSYCQCDECARARRERLRALTPSRSRAIDPGGVPDAESEGFLPERRPR